MKGLAKVAAEKLHGIGFCKAITYPWRAKKPSNVDCPIVRVERGLFNYFGERGVGMA